MNETERLAAIEEIKLLRARFARCMDTKQWVEMHDTISKDCVFDARMEGVVDELWIGAEDIVAHIRRTLETAVSVHHAHMPEIEITSPTTAKAIWAMQDFLKFQGDLELVGSGHYHEGYEKEADGKWRLKTYKLTRLRVDLIRSVDCEIVTASVMTVVGERDTALALGSGEVPVLGTPRVVALCDPLHGLH